MEKLKMVITKDSPVEDMIKPTPVKETNNTKALVGLREIRFSEAFSYTVVGSKKNKFTVIDAFGTTKDNIYTFNKYSDAMNMAMCLNALTVTEFVEQEIIKIIDSLKLCAEKDFDFSFWSDYNKKKVITLIENKFKDMLDSMYSEADSLDSKNKLN